jgi:predicted nucleic acid-binding protein
MTEVFLDASYAIALSARSDHYHERAVELSARLEAEGTRLLTTRAVVLEIGNALAKQRYRQAAAALLSALEEDPNVEIVPLDESLYERAFELYRQRPDKEWGLTDCVSFVVMQARGLTDALTADDHYRQAGFRALLQETETTS